jgi:hypothetical protein
MSKKAEGEEEIRPAQPAGRPAGDVYSDLFREAPSPHKSEGKAPAGGQTRGEKLREEVFGKENTRTSPKEEPIGKGDEGASAIEPAILEQAARLAKNSVSRPEYTTDRPFEGCNHGGANEKVPSRENGAILT